MKVEGRGIEGAAVQAAPRPFLSTHQAIAACRREVATVSSEIVEAATALARASDNDPVKVRLTPDRCIVQYGPVAVTVTWLPNSSEAPALGQLLAIVWRGSIVARNSNTPERLGPPNRSATPVSVWEQDFVASAANAASWNWHPGNVSFEGFTSKQVAERCIAQLDAEYQRALMEA